MVARTLSVFLRFALNALVTGHHPSIFLLPIPFASRFIPKEIPVHLGGFCLQASPGRGGASSVWMSAWPPAWALRC